MIDLNWPRRFQQRVCCNASAVALLTALAWLGVWLFAARHALDGAICWQQWYQAGLALLSVALGAAAVVAVARDRFRRTSMCTRFLQLLLLQLLLVLAGLTAVYALHLWTCAPPADDGAALHLWDQEDALLRLYLSGAAATLGVDAIALCFCGTDRCCCRARRPPEQRRPSGAAGGGNDRRADDDAWATSSAAPSDDDEEYQSLQLANARASHSDAAIATTAAAGGGIVVVVVDSPTVIAASDVAPEDRRGWPLSHLPSDDGI